MAEQTDQPIKPAIGRPTKATGVRPPGEELLIKKQTELSVKAIEPTSSIREQFGEPIIRQNKEFTDRLDTSKVILNVRATKLVVVGQDPEPDIFLPAGTPVNLMMALKEDLRVDSFSNIHAAVLEKYPFVGAVIEDLNKADDPRAEAAQKVLAEKSKVSYDDLQEKERDAVDGFIKDRFGLSPAADKPQVMKIYDSLRFLDSF